MKLLLDENLSSALRGHPPRVVKLTLGNSDNATVLAALLENKAQIDERFADPAVGLVELASPIE
jgi:predicted nuclease of predicted toxin-antitoxin system